LKGEKVMTEVELLHKKKS